MTDHQKAPLLRIREKFGYAVGDFACDLFFMFFIYYGLFFYTDVFGIPAAAAGTMFLITKLWDTMVDPIMGIIADRTNTRFGKFRPYLIWLAVPFGIIGIFAFSSPDFDTTGKIIYAYVTYTLMMMIYSAINIPYSALMGVMTPNSKDRTSLSSYRFALAFCGGIAVTGATQPLVDFYGGGSENVITMQTGEKHSASFTEKGVGTVQMSVTYTAQRDLEAEKRAGWLMRFQEIFIDMDHVQKRSTIWVNTRESILEHLFYTESGREKGLAALISQDRKIVVTSLFPDDTAKQDALLKKYVAKEFEKRKAAKKLSDAAETKSTDPGRYKAAQKQYQSFLKKYNADLEEYDAALAKELSQLNKDVLRAGLLDAKFGAKQAFELEIDGNFYLEKGFGSKDISLKTLFDDSSEDEAAGGEGEEGEDLKVDWSKAPGTSSLIDQQHGFQFCIATFAGIAACLFLVVFFSTKERVSPPKGQQTPILQDLKSVFSNRPWVVVGIMSMFTLAQVCIYGGAIVYYFKYFVGSPGLAGPFMLLGTISNLAGVFLTDPLTRLFGSKKRVYLILSMLTVPLNVSFFYLGPNDITIMFILTLLGGLASGPLSPIVWAMYADIADHSEWKTGQRATGLFFSAAMFAQKMGWTIGGAAAGWLLEYYGFEANIVQNETTIHGIKMLMSWIPAIGCFIAGILIVFYTLDDKQMITIEKELTERRKKAEEAEAAFTDGAAPAENV